MENNINPVNPEAEVVNIVTAIADNERSKAIDALQDLLYAKASETLSTYKQSVAKTYFDEPVETETNETDNGTD
jgi:GTP cyclohydrolase III